MCKSKSLSSEIAELGDTGKQDAHTGGSLERFWETIIQVSTWNERKVSQVLFRVVNRRLDDECQRACGTYGGAD